MNAAEATAIPSVPPRRAPRLPALTSLRFFLSLVVAALHYKGQIAPLSFGLVLDAIPSAVTGFFILSGFLLTYQYAYAGWSTRDTTFWKTRLARVAPLYWFCLAIAVLVLPLRLFVPAISKWAFITATNVLLVQGWFADPDVHFGWIPPAYTLSAEAFFYACFPAIMLTFSRWRSWLILAVVLAVGVPLAGAATGRADLETYANIVCPLGRLLEFVVGCVLAKAFLQHRDRTVRPVVTALLEAALFAVAVWRLLPGYGSAYLLARLPTSLATVLDQRVWGVTFYGVVVWMLAGQRGVMARVGSWRVLVFLGEASYALFLVHDVVVRFLMAHRDCVPVVAPALLFAGYLAVSVSLSCAAFVLVERPWRAAILGSAGFVRPAALAITLALALVAVSGGWNLVYCLSGERNGKPMTGAEEVSFGDAHTLKRICSRRRHGALEVLSLWEASARPDKGLFLTVQAVDAGGQALWTSTKVIARPPAGRRWAESFRVPRASLVGAQDLAIFVSGAESVLPVSSGRRDWSDCRLLLSVPRGYRTAG